MLSLSSHSLGDWSKHIRLRRLLREKQLSSSLISLYVSKSRVKTIADFIRQEIAECKNIKSRLTRQRVGLALSRIKSYVSTHSKNLRNGFVLFASAKQVYPFETPDLSSFLYRCGPTFEVEILERYLFKTKSIGVLIVTRAHCVMCLFDFRQMYSYRKLDSYIPGKTKKGGQSARRYREIRHNETVKFFNKIIQNSRELFCDVDSIYFGGLTPTRELFLQMAPNSLINRITKRYVIPYGNKVGINEVINRVKRDSPEDERFQHMLTFDAVVRGVHEGWIQVGWSQLISQMNRKQYPALVYVCTSSQIPHVSQSEGRFTIDKSGTDCISQLLLLHPETEIRVLRLPQSQSQIFVSAVRGVAFSNRDTCTIEARGERSQRF